MNLKRMVLGTVSILFFSCVAVAERNLDRTEILQIFEKLTSQSRKTWIAAGIIEATHEEYRAPKTTDQNEVNNQINKKVQEYQSNPNKKELTEELQKMRLDAIPLNVRYGLSNEYTMTSTVVVKFDGKRFYWEINVNSRTDSVKPDIDLENNFMTDQFDLNWNAKRIFAWDGENYTTYFLPGNHALVDTTGSTPHVINGPLTAGIIPWGYGAYAYDNLCAAESSAVERYAGGQAQIHLTLNYSDGSEMFFVIDPEKDFTLISCSIKGADGSIIAKQYSDYQLIAGSWVPTAILIERYDAASDRLLANDLWNLTRIISDLPGPKGFNVEYEANALIEYRSYVTDKPVMYRYSDMVDTDLLLAERLRIAALEGTRAQNCATIAMEYVLSKLGKEVTDQQLAELITEPNKTTSLYGMKEFAQGLGLYYRAVKTDLQTLKSLYDCEAILHIPGKNHFVVLGGIDNDYVWTVDLSNDRFFYRTDINFFGMDWTEGVALLISNQPIQLQGNFTGIDDAELHNIIGTAGYTCTRLLQEYNVIYCDNPVEGVCGGYYQVYFERWGCEAAPSGSCSSSIMIRMKESPCILDPYNPNACDVTGEWTCYYMRACK